MSTTHFSGPANLPLPSQAYKTATLSIVYKLSGLTFGSLLAAYSLGFVGSIAARPAAPSTAVLSVVLLSLQYASISVMFAYLTASFYLTYHTGILTMPGMPLERLGVDFYLAIMQALCFGFSMLCPWLFPILLAVNFLFTGLRQRSLHNALAVDLHKALCDRSDCLSANFHEELKRLLREEFSELSGWAPMGRRVRWFAGIIAVAGVAVAYLSVDFLPSTLPIRNIWTWRTNSTQGQILVTSEVVIIAALITIEGWRILKRRATFVEFAIKGGGNVEKSEDANKLQVSAIPAEQETIDGEKPGEAGNGDQVSTSSAEGDDGNVKKTAEVTKSMQVSVCPGRRSENVEKAVGPTSVEQISALSISQDNDNGEVHGEAVNNPDAKAESRLPPNMDEQFRELQKKLAAFCRK